jgi:MerR HTH family regulatory protein
MSAFTTVKLYSISEAARELGLSAEWLREGEKRGSLPKAKRGRNGYRVYTEEDIERLRNRRLFVHPSGERYLWHSEAGLEIAHVEAAELKRRLRELATATLIARHLPEIRDAATNEGGGRHDYAMALSGFMLRSGRLDEKTTLKILMAAWDAKGWPDEGARREAHRDLAGIIHEWSAALPWMSTPPRWSGFCLSGGAGPARSRATTNQERPRSASRPETSSSPLRTPGVLRSTTSLTYRPGFRTLTADQVQVAASAPASSAPTPKRSSSTPHAR